MIDYPAPQETSEAPVLSTWKTSVGMSVLGFFAFYLGLALTFLIVQPFTIAIAVVLGINTGASGAGLSFYNNIVSIVALIIWFGASIFYAAKVYPSYFESKPLFKSSGLISFLNFMFGWILFGALWNACLTKRKKGISHIVYIIIAAIILVSGLATMPQWSSTFQDISTVAMERSSSDTSIIVAPEDSLGKDEETKTYLDNETGTTFQTPSTWTEGQFLSEDDFIDIQFVNDKENEEFALAYGSYDVWSEVVASSLYNSERYAQPESMNSRNCLLSDFAELVDIPKSELNQINYGTHTFYEYTPAEYNTPSESVTMLFYMDNGYIYRVAFWDLGQNDDALEFFAISLSFPSDSSL